MHISLNMQSYEKTSYFYSERTPFLRNITASRGKATFPFSMNLVEEYAKRVVTTTLPILEELNKHTAIGMITIIEEELLPYLSI